MKFRCVKKQLEQVLKEAENFIGKNLDLPVLSCVLLKSANGFLNISATDIDVAFNTEIPVASEEDGIAAVTGDIFYKVLAGITSEEVEISLNKNVLKIKGGNSDIEINTLDHKDFPDIIRLEEQDNADLEIEINISKDDFLNSLNSVIYAVSKSNIKPELSSVLVSGQGDKIFFAGTDGFRLAEKHFTYQNNSTDEFSYLIPSSSIQQLIKVLNVTTTEVLDIFFYKNQVYIKGNEFVIFSRLTDGDYVDYKKLIPDDVSTSIIVLKQDFIDSGKLINIFTDDFNQVKFIVKNKTFKLETKNNIGKNSSKIKAVVGGDDFETDFNYKFIQEALNIVSTDSVEFIYNPAKPLLIRPIGEKTFKYIVMPLSR